MWTLVVCLLALSHVSAEVMVKVGDFTFPLETVKKLKAVLDDKNQADSPVLSDHIISDQEICSNHALPELQELCNSNQPTLITETLHGLEQIADNMDACEVCAFAACSGC
ncbi:guanylin [Leptodactylus fuscus]|uniref:guanylin n=1 Tax=Leptodactylus fuscus TaxID=238119 RepID=UPI003F4EF848